jgi:TRAP transporter TAXI family solute receptor
VARQILEEFGLTYEDVQARYLTFSESAASLRDGAIDAAIISVGYPAAAVLEATTTGGARLIPVERDRVESLQARYPYYALGVIPAGSYPGVVEDVSTVSMMNWVVAREDLEDEVVANLLSVYEEERVSLEQVHEMAGQINLANLDHVPIPLHAGVALWRERR